MGQTEAVKKKNMLLAELNTVKIIFGLKHLKFD